MKDSYGREIDYMRLSITDRCNLRCRYCMPDGIQMLSHETILHYEEILRICEAEIRIGIKKFKVTGGEPLVRAGVIEFIYKLKHLPGAESVTLTTNGVLLEPYLKDLKELGIDGINISIDTSDPIEFENITGKNEWLKVDHAIKKSAALGIQTKINCVLLSDCEDQILPLAEYARYLPVDVRFIELMPIGMGKAGGGMQPEGAREILLKKYPDLHDIKETGGNGPAHYERSDELCGRIGWIDAVSHSFCRQCNRIRLTCTGVLKPCLCYGTGLMLRELLRSGISDDNLQRQLRKAILIKPMQHSFADCGTVTESHIMAEIGG